jgi:peptidylprolyl isomerase
LWLALSGQKVGADVIVAFRPKAQAAEDGSSPPERPTYLLALTIVAVNAESDSEEGAPTPVAQFDRATGEPGEPTGPELPTVTLAANGEPSISFAPDQGPPDSMITEVLIVGSGDAAVGPDATVLAHYTGWLWDGEVFDSSWGGEPRAFPLSSVIQGWREGLAGHRVGSQLLLVVPPDLAYGDDPPQGIPPGATLVFVVDILGSAG